MKNFFTLFTFLCCLFYSHAQVGINTDSPQSNLDVNGDLTLRKELRLGGTPTAVGNPGQYGQVLFSQENSHQPVWKFVDVPFLEEGQIQLKYSYAESDETGIQFPTGAGDNDDISVIGEPLNNTWTEIPGLQTEIKVKKPVNKVSFFFQSGIEMPNTYDAESSNYYYVRYTCGLFLNDELIAVRADQIEGVNNKNAKNQSVFTLSYVMTDLPVADDHVLKVACRKIRTNSGGNYELAIGRSLSSGTQIANNFMLSSNLKVDVMEYIIN